MMLRADDRALAAAAEAIAAGGVVAVPTDTVYGLAARPADVDRLFELKARPAGRTIATLVADPDDRAELIVGSLVVDRLVDAFWPGALTIVAPARPGAPTGLCSEVGAIGVRCPDHDWTRSLLRRVGPLAVSSANRHGEPTLIDPVAIAEAFDPDVVVGDGVIDGVGSTVVSVVDGAAMLREGEITRDRLGPLLG